MIALDFLTVNDELRKAYGNDAVLDSHLERVNIAMRTFMMSLAGRNLRVDINTPAIQIHMTPEES